MRKTHVVSIAVALTLILSGCMIPAAAYLVPQLAVTAPFMAGNIAAASAYGKLQQGDGESETGQKAEILSVMKAENRDAFGCLTINDPRFLSLYNDEGLHQQMANLAQQKGRVEAMRETIQLVATDPDYEESRCS